MEQNSESALVLEQEQRAVRVSLVPRLDSALLKKKIGRQCAGFSVVLAVDIETPVNLSLNTAIIDLMRSSHHGAPFQIMPIAGSLRRFCPCKRGL